MKLNFQALSFSIDAQDLALALKDIDDAVELLKYVLISDNFSQQQLARCSVQLFSQTRNPEPSFDDSDVAPKDLKEQVFSEKKQQNYGID